MSADCFPPNNILDYIGKVFIRFMPSFFFLLRVVGYFLAELKRKVCIILLEIFHNSNGYKSAYPHVPTVDITKRKINNQKKVKKNHRYLIFFFYSFIGQWTDRQTLYQY